MFLCFFIRVWPPIIYSHAIDWWCDERDIWLEIFGSVFRCLNYIHLRITQSYCCHTMKCVLSRRNWLTFRRQWKIIRFCYSHNLRNHNNNVLLTLNSIVISFHIDDHNGFVSRRASGLRYNPTLHNLHLFYIWALLEISFPSSTADGIVCSLCVSLCQTYNSIKPHTWSAYVKSSSRFSRLPWCGVLHGKTRICLHPCSMTSYHTIANRSMGTALECGSAKDRQQRPFANYSDNETLFYIDYIKHHFFYCTITKLCLVSVTHVHSELYVR